MARRTRNAMWRPLVVMAACAACVTSSNAQGPTSSSSANPIPSTSANPSPEQSAPPSLPKPSTAESREQALRRQVSELKRERDDLAIRKTQLETQVASLKGRLETVKVWQKPQFVLGGRSSAYVVGLAESGSDFEVTSKSTGDEVDWAISAARKVGVPRISTPRAERLARQLYSELQPGDFVSSQIREQIQKEYWKSWQFVGMPPQANLSFVTYREVRANRPEVGILKVVSPESLTVRRVAAEDVVVQRGGVRPGTVWADDGDRIIPALEVGDSFLDYCLLAAAQKLSLPDDINGFVRVAVHVNIDQLLKSFEQGTPTQLFNIRYGEDGNNPLQGNGSFAPDNSSRRAEIDYQVDRGGMSASQQKFLHQQGRRIEDEIYERLLKLGVSVVEREYADQIKTEQAYQHVEDIRDFARLADATHLLVAELDESQQAARFRLSMRLIDLRDAAVKFAASDDEAAPTLDDAQQFVLNSGRPAILTAVTTDEKGKPIEPIDLKGFESPRRVPFVGPSSNKPPENPLVIFENVVGDELIYRPLFSRQLQSLPLDKVRYELFEATPQNLDSNATRTQKLRYAVWQLAQATLTPAGRILNVAPDGRTATVTLGTRHGLRPGDVLRVLRTFDRSGGDQFQGLEEMLIPARLTVQNVLADSSSVHIVDNGIDVAWQSEEMRPGIGDVVVSRVELPRRIAVLPPYPQRPTQGEAAPLWRPTASGAMLIERNKVANDATRVALEVQDQFVQSLSQFGPIVSGQYQVQDGLFNQIDADATLQELGAKQATHLLGGTLELESKTRFRVTMELRTLERGPSGKWQYGHTLPTKVEFTLGTREWN
ncbi:MAG: hypothetical protein KDA75_05745 [Planctomycetaceae bacterium]|nr:hypothetical protein [Planctomycetaceae bacterium]